MVSRQVIGLTLTVAVALGLGACAGTPATQKPVAACRGVGNGGGFTARGENELVYAVNHDSTGSRLAAAILVHAPPEWRRRHPPDSQPRQWHPPGAPRRMINGATAGPLWIGHEGPTGTVWLDSVPVPLHNDNVLLLEVGADEAPRIVGRARVDSSLPLVTGSCGMAPTREEAEAFEQALWAAVRRAPQVREFLNR